MSDVGRIFAHLSDTLAAGGGVLLLTDYDGTLTPIVADPADAWLPRQVWNNLRLLARSSRVRVGVVSGRDIQDVCARIRVPEVICAGCHGLVVA